MSRFRSQGKDAMAENANDDTVAIDQLLRTLEGLSPCRLAVYAHLEHLFNLNVFEQC